MTIRVFLLDDHEMVREGIRNFLEIDDDIEVVGQAATVAEALTRIPLTKPDVAILDVRLDDGSGIEVCREIRSNYPEITCLMLDRKSTRLNSSHLGISYAVFCLK